MREFLHHLFIPRESNNHRSYVLHHTNLFLTIAFLLLTSFFFQKIRVSFPSVLGIQVDISSQELLLLTNKQRQDNGIAPLSFNEKLSQAASQKADDMFAYNYWAHNSPTGKTPWVFIKSSGYEYVYAGENLARGFSTAQDAVNAWMASPDHRANMLSSNYKDVGFAVKVGNLNGEETALIVEELGSSTLPIAKANQIQEVATAAVPATPNINTETQKVAKASEINNNSQKAPIVTEETIPSKSVVAVNKKPFINSSFFSLSLNMIIVLVFIFALLLDMIVIEKKKVMRFVGHNFDHILYLLLILALVGILSKGVII